MRARRADARHVITSTNDKTIRERRRNNQHTAARDASETSPGTGSGTARILRTRRRPSQATPPPAVVPSAPAGPPPPPPADPAPQSPDQEQRGNKGSEAHGARKTTALLYLSEEEGAEEAGEEEEGAGDEHHGEPQPRPHQTPAAGAAGANNATPGALHAAATLMRLLPESSDACRRRTTTK